MTFITEILCANIGYPDVHAGFFLDLFYILKCVFYMYLIIGVPTPRSQNATLLYCFSIN